MKANTITSDITDIDELTAALDTVDARAILNSCMSFSHTIRGTSSFWKSKGNELRSLVTFMNYLGRPANVFFTFSAADLHWYELQRLLGVPIDANDFTKYHAVKSNPLLTTWAVDRRWQLFEEMVLKKHLHIDVLWVRVEFQARGSAHFHGIMSLINAPDMYQMVQNNQHDELIAWVNEHIQVTAIHPDPGSLLPGFQGTISRTNPASRNYLEVVLDAMDQPQILDEDLRHIINTVQRHRCREGYCIKISTGTCRFHYPKELLTQTRIVQDDKQRWVLQFERNDQILNEYCKVLLQIWRANMDFRPIIDPKDIVWYVTKYISKSEKKSSSYVDVLRELIHQSQLDQTLI